MVEAIGVVFVGKEGRPDSASHPRPGRVPPQMVLRWDVELLRPAICLPFLRSLWPLDRLFGVLFSSADSRSVTSFVSTSTRHSLFLPTPTPTRSLSLSLLTPSLLSILGP